MFNLHRLTAVHGSAGVDQHAKEMVRRRGALGVWRGVGHARRYVLGLEVHYVGSVGHGVQ